MRLLYTFHNIAGKNSHIWQEEDDFLVTLGFKSSEKHFVTFDESGNPMLDKEKFRSSEIVAAKRAYNFMRRIEAMRRGVSSWTPEPWASDPSVITYHDPGERKMWIFQDADNPLPHISIGVAEGIDEDSMVSCDVYLEDIPRLIEILQDFQTRALKK